MQQGDKILSTTKIIDYDIHGIVGIRLINPTAGDTKVVANQLGRNHGPLGREPDILIHFKKELPTPSLNYLGLDYAGFTDESFYIFSPKDNAKMRIPFDRIGHGLELVCKSGLHAVPWLIELINLTFLKKNHIPLHASAFVYNGLGIVITGWTKGGKTETLLAFGQHGAQYVGDEWVVLSGNGDRIFGTPVPICIWEWQFDQIPELLPKIRMHRKIIFKSVHFLDYLNKFLNRVNLASTFPARILDQALPAFKRQLNIRVLPEAIFRSNLCPSATFDLLIFSASHNHSNILLRSCSPDDIARRMIHSNICELLPFLEYYQAFKFAFPERRNELLENIYDIQHSLLCKSLKNKAAYKLLHPYPVAFQDLFDQLNPIIGMKTGVFSKKDRVLSN